MKTRVTTAAVAAMALLAAGEARAQMSWGAFSRSGGAAMVEHGGKLYVVSGSTLARLDAATLKVEAKKDLSDLGKTDEEKAAEERERRSFMEKYDADNDGLITMDELDRRRFYIYRYDRNGDRKLSADELKAMGRPAPAASGEAVLLLKKGKLYLLRSGMVFLFDPDSLELKETAVVVERPKPAAPPKPAPPGAGPGGPRREKRPVKADDAPADAF